SSNLECVICHDTETGLMVSLDCGHKYHQTCVKHALKVKSCCPICGYIVGVPKADILEGATMTHSYLDDALPGYEGYDTIKIKYHVPDGIQGPNHPNPGHVYTGTYRTGYLPNCTEGIEVFQLLRKAFDAGLIFTVGTSLTTGVPNTVVWNDIHHKTDFTGTYGYPDPGYLTRVKEDLKAKGVY
uniref:E3 ubiquitin-protein ligase n=1 Tax=Ciona savignyi TaxID=51511 RepID=H2ZBN7_CIOSA